MASASAVEIDRYALVSSFYGPGAVGGWYLTTLACLISFGLHPRKRRADSITADMIAVLTFPTVAAAHLISQIRSCPTEMSSATLVQKAASMEAALIIIKTSWAIAGILFLPAVGFRCVKRGCLLAAVGLFCISAQCYLYFPRFVMRAIQHDLDRSYLMKFGSMRIPVMAVLLYFIVLALALIVLFFAMFPSHSRSQVRTVDYNSEASAQDRFEGLNQDFVGSRNVGGIKWVTMLSLPFSLVASVFPSTAGILEPPEPLLGPRTAVSHVIRGLIPASNTSVRDLDQAVAILAGASVLGFSIYDVANAYYNNWKMGMSARPQSEEVELATLARRQHRSR